VDDIFMWEVGPHRSDSQNSTIKKLEINNKITRNRT